MIMSNAANKGIKTTFWGPHAWVFLFSTIAGSYPVRVDHTNSDHVQKVRAYVSMLKSLKHTLPCSFCRDSYSLFLKDLPIENYTHSRREMLYWLYQIHDKVNKKLIQQEREMYERKKTSLQTKKLTPTQRKAALAKLKSKTLKTKASPPFDQVVGMYNKHRAN